MPSTETRSVKARENWIKCYQELGSVSRTALKCGVPRSTIYRWIKRFNENGKDGLASYSKRPKVLARQKVNKELIELVKSLRLQNKLGPQAISSHLLRNYNIEISSTTIWRLVKQLELPNIKGYKGKRHFKRYSKNIPGERVQMDVTKVAAKCYQFTAVDDCTRLRAMRLYPNKKAESTIDFLSYVLDVFQFPIQRIQTDWGTEFFNELFQEELMIHFIKFRPIKPRSPHLNGKVERSQLTGKAEFYINIPKKERTLLLNERLQEWQNFYNHKRPHASLNGRTPYEKYLEVEKSIPIQPDVTSKYWEKDTEILTRNSIWHYRKLRSQLSQMS